jgi:hypothetical protein
VLKKILPSSLLDSQHPTGIGPMMLLYIDTFVDVFPASIGIEEFRDKKIADERANRLYPILFSAGVYLMDSLPDPTDSVFGAGDILKSGFKREDPALILTGLNQVDTKDMSWRHILELREDQESVSRLRRLRTFIFENYQDKPLSFIKDDILNRIDIYETTAKQWGLKTKESILKIIFNSGTALAVTAATIASLVKGIPISVSLPLGIGTTFLTGNIILEISSYSREVHRFKQENPITYLIEINKKN